MGVRVGLSAAVRFGSFLGSGRGREAARHRVPAGQAVRAADRVAHDGPAGAVADEHGTEPLVVGAYRLDVRAGDVEVGGGGAGGVEALQEDAEGARRAA